MKWAAQIEHINLIFRFEEKVKPFFLLSIQFDLQAIDPLSIDAKL